MSVLSTLCFLSHTCDETNVRSVLSTFACKWNWWRGRCSKCPLQLGRSISQNISNQGAEFALKLKTKSSSRVAPLPHCEQTVKYVIMEYFFFNGPGGVLKFLQGRPSCTSSNQSSPIRTKLRSPAFKQKYSDGMHH